jgi:hypothetical protein
MSGVPQLPVDVAKDYDCVKVVPGEVIWRNKSIDLTKIDLVTAKQLESEKFPYLKRKVSSPSPAKSTSI